MLIYGLLPVSSEINIIMKKNTITIIVARYIGFRSRQRHWYKKKTLPNIRFIKFIKYKQY